jgi:hypothetical protein
VGGDYHIALRCSVPWRVAHGITVFSNPGMSLERPEIDEAKRVDPL